jgi:ATP-dependent Clp protease adaptor protein ClpS
MNASDDPILVESPEVSFSEALDHPWLVVVHNDPVNLMSYVSMVFRRLFGWSRERAARHIMEVHKKGRSVVWSGGREQAELFVQQLHSHLLLATLERSPQ